MEALQLSPDLRVEIEAAARSSAAERVRRKESPRVRESIEAAPPLLSIPSIATSFVGRDEDLLRVDALLQPGWCVTIWGTGGAGKTRLALEAARAAAPRFAGGAYFIELADLTEPPDVARALAAALGVREALERSLLTSIVSALSERRALIVLDNAEHLIAECARIVEHLLRAVPSLTILCTSREPLHIAAEHVHPLHSLPIPLLDDPAVLDSPAVRLFLDRARSAGARIDLHRDMRSIATICGLVDAIPLALELAAARSPAMTPEQIARGLADDQTDRLRLLTRGSRNAGARHQTLTGTLDWSVALLNDLERIVLSRVAVWPGKWTLDDAVAVVSDAAIDRWAAIDAIASLVDRALVIAHDIDGKERTYRLLQTTRTYIVHRGDMHVELERSHRAQAARIAERLEIRNADYLRDGRPGVWSIELSPIRAALRWTITLGNDIPLGAKIAAGARGLWAELNAHVEGVAWLHDALALIDAGDAAAFEPLIAIAGIERDLMQYEAAYAAAARALAIADRGDDSRKRANARLSIALSASVLHGNDAGRTMLEEALTLYEQIGDQRKRLEVVSELAGIAMLEGRFADARAYVLPLPAGFRGEQNIMMASISESNLAEIEFGLGNTAEAIRLASGALEVLRGLNTLINVAITTHNLAGYLLEAEDVASAVRLARESLEIALNHGWKIHAAIAIGHLADGLAADGAVYEAALLAGFLEHNVGSAASDYRTETELRTHHRLMQRLNAAFSAGELARLMHDGERLDRDDAAALALDATAEQTSGGESLAS
jgi:predicted ATPase